MHDIKTSIWITIATLVVAGSLIGAPMALGQEEMARLDNDFFDSPRRPAAIFSHDEHNEAAGLEDCAQCHHVYDEDGTISAVDSSEDQLCGDCHSLRDEGPKPGLRKAFHQRCRGCHLASREGPVTCAECHVNG